jgi:hypothetical protein
VNVSVLSSDTKFFDTMLNTEAVSFIRNSENMCPLLHFCWRILSVLTVFLKSSKKTFTNTVLGTVVDKNASLVSLLTKINWLS